MNVKLASLCLKLWTLGFLGMWMAKGIFDMGPGTAGFNACALLWVVGGATYALLGTMCVLEPQEERQS